MDAELDCTIDETTFVTASPVESGAGVTFRIMGKPNISKGEQSVLVYDANYVQPSNEDISCKEGCVQQGPRQHQLPACNEQVICRTIATKCAIC